MSGTQDGRPRYGDQPGGQPPNGPQQYGYPQYGAPQYGYQQYGAPQGVPQQYGIPPNLPPPAAPPKKRKKWPWILLAAFLLVLGIFACTAGGGEEGGTDPGGTESTSDAEGDGAGQDSEDGAQPLGIGDTGQLGDWMVTVNGTETSATAGDEYFEERAQGEFVLVDLTVENGGSESTFFDETALTLIDTDGNSHNANSSVSGEFFLEQINPGNQVTGKAAFDVPVGTEVAALEVEDVWSFEEPIEIELD